MYKILPYSSGRVDIWTGISKSELKEIALNKNVTLIQFSEPLTSEDFDNLNEHIFSTRSDIELRAYGHYSQECDLSFLKHFTHLKKFSADCIIKAINENYISSLESVEELHIGIYGLTSLDFLNRVNPNLKKLMIGSTFSKKPVISMLSRFKNLNYLYIEGQTKGIDSISSLVNLEKLILRSVTVSNLDFLKNLKKLWSVDIKLGGTKNFSALRNLPGIKYLELWQINKLDDISFISEMPDLQNLFIQSLRNIETLPDFSGCTKLRRISLENLKGLKDLSSLKTAPALEEFSYSDARNQNPQNLIQVLENKNLKHISVGFGSQKKNDEFEELAKSYGKETFDYHNFGYN